ncbi:MAG TPA: prepilin-type N-terminal cleavage/methylation domain-containing protein [Candidatus Paceibacterota bacterium]|nr:prepilin-type N-terminal cleavage/methylation domain-containing protein [Candidatus Paceibacterota bacterium]
MEPFINRPVRGFTLVEMLVVLAIIVIITAIALLGQTTFNRSLVLTDIAYTIAFSIREAQSYGISSRAAGATTNAGYGISFARTTPTSYVLFADTNPAKPGDTGNPSLCPGHPSVASSHPEAKPGNCIQNNATEIVRRSTLNNGFKIKSFCGKDSGTEKCSDSAQTTTRLESIHIVYLRPNTQSIITGVSAGSSNRVALSDATIRITSPDETAERCVLVSKAGQVSVVQKGTSACP